MDRPVTFALLAWLTLVGCGPSVREKPPADAAERYADAVCLAHERCKCVGSGFVDREECVASSMETFAWVEKWPEVKFDAECFEEFLDHTASNATCGGRLEQAPAPCLVFEGGLLAGEACVSEVNMGPGGLAVSSCAGGAECVAGRCARPPRPSVAVAESCLLSEGVTCGSGPGIYCSSAGICDEEKALGEACDTPLACEMGLYCQGLRLDGGAMGTCTEVVALGAECDPAEFRSCERSGAGAYCSNGTGRCEEAWPAICEIAALPSDGYWPADWIPL